MTDFGIPKVIGGNFNMLATDVFKLVIGQQDFQRGAVVGLLLLMPAVLTFGIDWLVQRKQTAHAHARAPCRYVPQPARGFDALMLGYVRADRARSCWRCSAWRSSRRSRPTGRTTSRRAASTTRWASSTPRSATAFFNSLKLAAGTAFFGTIIVFVGAYMLEKTRGCDALRAAGAPARRCCRWRCPAWCSAWATSSSSTRRAIRCTACTRRMTLLVVCTIVHFYTTGHLTAVTALKSLDAEFEAVSASLKVPFFKTFWRVTLPICTPTLLDIARYFFINAMTTISAVVFLYSPDTKVASIAILNLDEAGEAGAAAACAVLITAGSTVVTLLFMALGALGRPAHAGLAAHRRGR